jgi:hypothetical protein
MYKGQYCPMINTAHKYGQHLCQIIYTKFYPTIGGNKIKQDVKIWVNNDDIKIVITSK